MIKMYTVPGQSAPDFPLDYKLILNTSNPLIQKINDLYGSDPEKASVLAKHILHLATLSQRKLSADELKHFLTDSYSLLSML